MIKVSLRLLKADLQVAERLPSLNCDAAPGLSMIISESYIYLLGRHRRQPAAHSALRGDKSI